MDKLVALKMPILWLLVIGAAIGVVLVASGVRVPGLEPQIAVSKETRDAAATARAPTYSRAQAIDEVRRFILADCDDGDAYLRTPPQFHAEFLAQPRTNDHHERGDREWTVNDQLTGNMWRFYEGTGEVIRVLGEC